MIPPEIAATLREALDNLREHKGKYTRIDSKTLKWEPDTSALATIDAAIAYLDTLPAAPAPDDNGGRRWWRMRKGDDSEPMCIDIAEMEWYWLQGYRPDYPIQLTTLQARPIEPPQATE